MRKLKGIPAVRKVTQAGPGKIFTFCRHVPFQDTAHTAAVVFQHPFDREIIGCGKLKL
jgi:hypothetical protein